MRSSTKACQPVNVPRVLPLPTLLPQVLVAFTIEFDNEFERLMPHRTTTGGLSDPEARHAPWLTSLVMWANVMQYIGKEGIKAGELLKSARIAKENFGMSLKGLSRWRIPHGEARRSQKRGESAERSVDCSSDRRRARCSRDLAAVGGRN